ncbi:ventrally expressed dharma/bozozok antagonist [Gouania willdenowi]|uniref:Homeobox protein vex1-like n=1 Tax=Gouania willdenowi TaxID=441366 RepID=A0A8C5G7L0_GOUWI|nr:homeobox protein vex1-like [Gouania willdenowi]
MRSVFSVEWLAQSSQTSITTSTTPSMSSHSPPASYWAQKPQEPCDQDRDGTRNQSYQQEPPNQGTESSFSPAEDTSDYDSEERPSTSPSSPSPRLSPQVAGGRRSRTAFTAEQISCLEETFKKNAYLGTQDKAELCRKLNLSDKQVRNWFQNRRMKMKRSVQDALAHVCQASPFLRYADVPTFPPLPHPPPYVHAHTLQLAPTLPSLHTDQYSQYYQYGAVMPPASAHYYPQYY